ncbi:MAG TPA: L-lactate dehydrogenase [Anaerolineae bacterium]|nr:L-lactate dehydrogenase [Anaerolineae bacterium]HQK14206.1 L-lactate dehydrogenase [Anaerolineae bacterium]
MRTTLTHRRKVVIVGAGAVGATFAYALAQSGLSDEIALIDRNEDLVRGQVLDLAHGQPFFPTVHIRAGSPADYADARLIVLTAGVAQRPGETRLQLLQKNAAVVRAVATDIMAQNSTAVLLVVTNPVDVMTYVALRYMGWERGRVIGSGTVLDSARLRHLLSTHCEVDIHNVHGYVLGEHGDSEFVAWSMTHVAGMPIDAFCPVCGRCANWEAERDRIQQEVRDSAYHIIGYKGATSFAVGLALVRIAGTVLRGENSVLTVSTLLDGEFGLRDVCLSIPCLVSAHGVSRIIESALPEREQAALLASAAVLREAIEQLETAE